MAGGRGIGGAAPSVGLGNQPLNPATEESESRQDDFGLDPQVRDLVFPFFRFLHDKYFRVEVTGARHVPADGPALLVSNHSGAIPVDGAMLCTTVEIHCQRALRFLYDRFVDAVSPVATFYRKCGGAVAAKDTAENLLQAGEPVLIFPEGVSGVAKPFADRYRLRPFSAGFARLAMDLDVPVIPVAVVGAEEMYPMVGRIEAVGRALGMPYVPVTPFFPLLGPLGALPLPTKWFIRFGKPIRLAAGEGENRAQRAQIEAVRVRGKVQAMVRRLRAQRRSVFLG